MAGRPARSERAHMVGSPLGAQGRDCRRGRWRRARGACADGPAAWRGWSGGGDPEARLGRATRLGLLPQPLRPHVHRPRGSRSRTRPLQPGAASRRALLLGPRLLRPAGPRLRVSSGDHWDWHARNIKTDERRASGRAASCADATQSTPRSQRAAPSARDGASAMPICGSSTLPPTTRRPSACATSRMSRRRRRARRLHWTPTCLLSTTSTGPGGSRQRRTRRSGGYARTSPSSGATCERSVTRSPCRLRSTAC